MSSVEPIEPVELAERFGSRLLGQPSTDFVSGGSLVAVPSKGPLQVDPAMSWDHDQNAERKKRTFWNARSERRRGFSGFMDPEKPPNPFFAPCKKDPLCHIEFFNNVSKSSWTSVISSTIKFVRGQNLFLSEKKKDPGRKANLPHKPGEARTFFASPKKGSGVGKINFLVASYTILSP